MSIETSTKRILVVASAVLATMLPAGYALKLADSEGGAGAISRFSYATAEDLVQTTSTAFVPMPDMLTTFFVRPADRLMPMVIRLNGAANTLASGMGSVRLQVKVDGVALPFADDLQLTADPLRLPFSFTWIVPDLPAGFHTVEVFWKNSVTGGTAIVQDRCLIVEGH